MTTTSFKQQLLSGVFYTALAKYSGILISLVVAGVLARLISPDDFGVVAIATVIIAFFGIFTDMGISPAIVQHKELTTRQLADIFAFTLWMGVVLSVGFFVAAWPIAAYYGKPVLLTLCRLLAVNLLFASANIVPSALFYKNKEFRFIAIRSFIIQTASGAAAVIAALCDAGLYALIIAPILSSVLLFIISIRRYPQQLRLTWGMGSMRLIFSYSAYQFLFNVINYFSRNLDKLLIGKYMGMSPLGYYEKSYRLMMLPLQNITQVITPVMHPLFSDYRDDPQRMATAYERIVRMLAFIGIPLSVLLFFTAHELTLILFGDQWLPSVAVFRILTLSVGIQIILSSSGSIFQAMGDTRSLFVCGLFSSVLNVGGMLLGVFYFGTLEAVAWCICITFAINFGQCYGQLYRVTMRRSLWLFVNQLKSPILLSLLCAATLLPLQEALEGGNLFATLATKSLLFFVIVGGYIQLSGEYNIIGKVKTIINKRKQ